MNMSVSSSPLHRSRFLILRVLMYLLPGTAAAGGAVLALLAAGRVTPALVALTALLVVLGFAGPPVADWLHARYVRQRTQMRLADRDRRKRAEAATAQLRDHFGPLGRGVLPSSVRSGSYFTGRLRVLGELSDWLAIPGLDTRARVVTGAPGSGKSAVLGRLVWLAGVPIYGAEGTDEVSSVPETMPLRGLISAALHARGRTADEVATEIAQALNINESSAGALIAALREVWQPRSAVVLVDAVDEAADPYRLIVELLEPLAAASQRTKIRLLVGTRRGGDDGLLRLFGASALVVDLDSPGYLDVHDVEEYACRTLVAKEDPKVITPYSGRPELASAVARGIAAKSGKSFLVAQLSALSLTLAAEPIDIAAPNWAEALPTTVGAAMERYLREVRPSGRWLRDLLMALAWSQGDGLDDLKIWAEAATVVGTGEYSERDVARLLLDTSAVDLLQHSIRGERVAFRLFHEALAEYLRHENRRYQSPADTQQRLAGVLIAHVPQTSAGRPDWSGADVYTRTYLSFHAAQGKVLDALLNDAGFLATAEPGRLLAALPAATTDRGRCVARIVERVGQQLLQALPGEQVCYLEMAARMVADDLLVRDLAEFAPQRPWSVAWAHWEPLDQGRLLGHHNDYAVAVSAVDTGRGTIVVSASAWAIRAWSLPEGSPVASGLGESPSPIADMVAFADAEDVVVLTLHGNGDLRRSTLGGTTATRTLARGLTGQRLWLISYSGQPAVVTATRDKMVEVLSAVDGSPVGLPPIGIGEGGILTAASTANWALAVIMSDPGESRVSDVAVWDLNTGTAVGSPLLPSRDFPGKEARQIWAATVTERDGYPVLLGGSEGGGPVFVWDPIRAQLLGKPHFGLAVYSTLLVRTGHSELQCWGDSHGNLHLRSGDVGIVRHIAAHDSGIEAIAAAYDADGSAVIVTAGRDGAVRVWNLNVTASTRPLVTTGNLVVVPPANGGRTLIAAIQEDGTAVVADAADGQVVPWPKPAPGAFFQHIAVLSGDMPAILTIDSQNEVAIWRPVNGHPEVAWDLPPGIRLSDIAVTSGEHPILLAAQTDGRLAFFDVFSGRPVRASITCARMGFRLAVSSQQAGDSVQFATAAWRAPDARRWTISDGEITQHVLKITRHPQGYRTYVGGLLFTFLGERRVIIGVGGSSSLHIWDARDGSLIVSRYLEQAHGMILHGVDIVEVAGRPLILCGGYTCSLALWSLDTRDEHHLRVGSPLWSVKSLPDGRVVVAGPRGILAFQLSADLPGCHPIPN